LPEVEFDDDVITRAERPRDALRRFHFGDMALSVSERHRLSVEALARRDGEHGGPSRARHSVDHCKFPFVVNLDNHLNTTS